MPAAGQDSTVSPPELKSLARGWTDNPCAELNKPNSVLPEKRPPSAPRVNNLHTSCCPLQKTGLGLYPQYKNPLQNWKSWAKLEFPLKRDEADDKFGCSQDSCPVSILHTSTVDCLQSSLFCCILLEHRNQLFNTCLAGQKWESVKCVFYCVNNELKELVTISLDKWTFLFPISECWLCQSVTEEWAPAWPLLWHRGLSNQRKMDITTQRRERSPALLVHLYNQ